jgi:hypothetical protein
MKDLLTAESGPSQRHYFNVLQYGACVAGSGIPTLDVLENAYMSPDSNHIETHSA